MKILLATDGSAHSKAMVKKFADRTFAPNSKVRIITAYARTSFMMNTAPMGALSQYYAEIDENSLKSAENASESAAIILRKKIPIFLFLLLPLMALQKMSSFKKRSYSVLI